MSPIRLKRPGNPEPLCETAAEWVLRAEQGLSTAEEQRLHEWLREPAHAQAYDDALWALDTIQRHAGSPELMGIREAALSREPKSVRGPSRTAGLAAVAAAFAGLLLWIGTGSLTQRPQPDTLNHVVQPAVSPNGGLYRTGIGERSGVVFPDGSIATLDTNSQLRVAYSNAERGVYLLKGQALFEVAKGQPKPFQVYAGGQRITALGTAFNVRIQGNEVQVAMVEGVVRVRSLLGTPKRGAPVQELTLRAGDSLVTSQAQPPVIKAIDTSQVATWRGGLLVFEDEKLSDAVAEINRYTNKPIKLADSSIGQYRVTGVFKTNDPARFATAMSGIFPVEVDRDRSGAPVLKARQ